MIHIQNSRRFVAVLATVTLLASCASASPVVEADVAGSAAAASPPVTMPPFTGQKMVVGVLPFGLSERVAMLYPKLRDNAVGLGVHNLVESALTDTSRFRFVETNPQIIKDILERQWSSNAGFTTGDALKYGALLGATKVIYGEVFDYSEGGEQVRGLNAQKKLITRVGIQVICTDVTTGERIAIGSGTGVGPDYGAAVDSAIRQAVLKMISRM
jgi:hypothetical protein